MVQQYQPLDLADRLQRFRNQKFTGLLCFQSEQKLDPAGTKHYFVSFLLGEINYVGNIKPDIVVIAEQLTEHLDHPFFKMGFRIAREQSKGSDSPRDVLAKMVSTRIVTWAQIESVMQSQAESMLRLMAQSPGTMTSESSGGTDLCFGDDSHGLAWSLLQQVLENPTSSAPGGQPSSLSPLQSGLEEAPAVPLPVDIVQVTPQNATTRPTILSVDDSPIVQKMIQRALSQECNVLLADNALVALKMLNTLDEIALILLDVNMPGITGLDFCRTLRGIPKFKTLPVIMLTANEGRVSKAMGQIAGSTLYLTKPVDDQKLLSVIRKYTSTGGTEPGTTAQASLSAV